ncbi:D-alanyl-D-alanine dipeptidase [Candidatus Syntrophocurvum alkaliphilum]|uniref:D-alanyl-D-alanine dipeptidase n=1 Tax=Candidatus Syntrophocurvum alkaliphilum TaxID=2293317 RepID=A0A6I6DDP0_9FIRM|nr:M15 family metallopeptidase [Candidatus Syntrophocurvum alkaliphilum]QGT99386.1 D-alanyl-D-alanine dipeptidase [Candidatus Syntrophocurvum alkaliphilum]
MKNWFNRRNLLTFSVLAIMYLFFVSYNLEQMPVKKEALEEKPTNKPNTEVVETSPYDMVEINEIAPNVIIELRYATDNNVFGESVYDTDIAYLRRGTAEKLNNAQNEAEQHGYSLKVWDPYRPPEAQFKLWEIMPDSRYVANPHTGYSFHSTGAAVDVTLVDNEGYELLMPSEFDDFTPRANRDYTDIPQEAAENSILLEEIMINNGFESIFFEWWHFVDSDRDKYEVIDSSEIPGFND